ncbi:hypothetical protein HCN44_008746 [Aphidius gifuensis]|uniref:Anoctamin n=1 Tax=Aphidius gifuensis TaxID=684658 RepID=A0A834Y129_APHGI|nr:hypothetical protein HCN44_008746 [Aphidius gifuensis]
MHSVIELIEGTLKISHASYRDPALHVMEYHVQPSTAVSILGTYMPGNHQPIAAIHRPIEMSHVLFEEGQLEINCHIRTPFRVECDIVVIFPKDESKESLIWLLERLRTGTPGLVISVHHHESSGSDGFYITAPFLTLLKAAEEVSLPKALRQEYGGHLTEFVCAEVSCFKDSDDEGLFFTSQERQSLVLHQLYSLRATQQDVAGLPSAKLVEGEAVFPKCLSEGVISQVFPLHEIPKLEKLQKHWVQTFLSLQPIDDIYEYFGVKITMHFAWLRYYTMCLVVPTALGVIYWVGIIGRNQELEDVVYVLFSTFNLIWTIVYLETWKRKIAELTYKWGTLEKRDGILMKPRPLNEGTCEISPFTKGLRHTYPNLARNAIRCCITLPTTAVFLFFVFIVMILSFRIQDRWDEYLKVAGYELWLSYIPKVLLAMMIALMDEAYLKIAIRLNDLENYCLPTEYENHLIYKVALFQFVNSFLSLFYIAFYLQDQEKLREQLAALLITRQIISTFKKSTNPCVIEKLRFARSRFETMCPSEGNPTTRDEKDHMYNSSEQPEHSDGEKKETKCTGGKQSRKMKQAELESLLYKFGPANFLGRDVTYKTDGAFLEHLEKLLQLGYVSLFSSALPLAAATALLGNLVEISGDSFQICFLSQRPFGQRVSRIGFWQNAMEAIGIASILINCVLIGLSSQVQRMFPKLSADKKIIVIVAFEHALMAMRFMITYAVFNLPTWMATKVTQVEYHSQKAMLHSSSTEQQIQTVIGRFMVTPSAKEDQEPITPFKFPVDLETRENLSDFQTSVTSLPGLEKSNLGKKSLSQIKIRGSICSDFESFSPKFLRSSQDLQYPPRYSILGGIEGHGSRHKIASEGVPLSPNADQYNHHLTIDNHGGIEWIRNIDRSRARIRNIRDSNVVEKSVNVENDVHGNKNSDSVEQSVYQSVVCIPLAETVSSLDNHLLRSIQTWNTGHKNQKLQLSPENEVAYGRKKNDNLQQQSSLKQLTTQHLQIQDHYDKKRSSNNTEPSELYDSSHAFLCQDDGKLFEEDKEAKKTRIKQSLMKRARSVAIFSLKLKERRARDTEIKKKELEKEIRSQKHDRKVQPCVSGELSCIPIEMLISVDDIAAMDESKTNS